MTRRELADYYAALDNDAERDHQRRLLEDGAGLDAPRPRVCAGSKYGRHRFTTRKDASGRLMCDFCTELRMSDQP